MALVEIDGLPSLPIKNGGSFHGYVSHNQRVLVNGGFFKWASQSGSGGNQWWNGAESDRIHILSGDRFSQVVL